MSTVLLALTSGAVLAAAVIAVALLGVRRRADAVLAVALVASTLVVADALVLGFAGHLSRWPLVGVAVLQVAAGLTLLRAHPKAAERLRRLPRAAVRGGGDIGRALRSNALATGLLGVAALVTVRQVVVGLAVGVKDYDGLSYHLPMVLTWVQQGRIGQRIPINPFADAYPGNVELIAAWMTAMRGDDLFAVLTQAPFALVGAAAAVAVGRRLGLRLEWALAAAGLFLACPVVLNQIPMLYNDLAGTSAFVAGLHLAAVAVDEARRAVPGADVPGSRHGYDGPRHRYRPAFRPGWGPMSYAVVGAAALGLAAGTKPTYALGAAAAVVLLVVLLGGGGRRALASVGVAIGVLLLVGAPFYLRNLAVFGNPLAPFAVDAGPLHLPGALDLYKVTIEPSTPPELRDSGWPVTPLLWLGYQVATPYWRVQDNFGWQWPLLLLPALLAWVTDGAVAAVRRCSVRPYVVVLLVPMLLATAVHPTPWVFRYVMFLLVPAAVALCAVLQRLWAARRPHGRTLVVAAGALAFVCAVQPLSVYWWVEVGHEGASASRSMTLPQFAGAVMDGESLRVGDQPGADWAQDLPPGTVIAVARPSWPAPLYGRANQNRLLALPTDVGAATRRLSGDGINYLVVSDTHPLARWADSRHGRFVPISAVGGMRCYRVVESDPTR
jgi:hypothetical protein